ncbi:MAG: site-specific DNA-methyltransferase, partial [Methanoregulaceae archaeon]|nr:site-specific DNA-methyltransferase [Methanoregulaceae archaeon]
MGGNDTNIHRYLKTFRGGRQGEEQHTDIREVLCKGSMVPQYVNEFWTSRQRAGSSLHEVPYRACFKSQLPAFFIKLLT